jgi:hypothetical protein
LSAAVANSASFSAATVDSPRRPVSLTRVVGWDGYLATQGNAAEPPSGDGIGDLTARSSEARW